MKNRIVHLFNYLFIQLFLLCSCSDFLDPTFDGTLTEDEVFVNAYYFCGPLNEAYNSLNSSFDISSDCLTDNAVYRDLSDNYYLCGNGALRPNNNPNDNWVGSYRQIRNLNQFLARMVLDEDPDAVLPTPVLFYKINTPQDRTDNIREFKRLYAEAHFLRAYYLFEALRNFGGVTADGRALGVPLIGSRVLEVTDDNNIPRSSYADCVTAIVADCDTAFAYFKNLGVVEYRVGTDRVSGTTQNGRANGISALALKARVLLYAASPAYNIDGSAEDKRKVWEKAAIASAEAIMSVNGGFQNLVNSPVSSASEDIGSDYYFRQLQVRAWNEAGRDLFFRANNQNNNRSYENSHYPPSMLGQALVNPSQNFVDAFPDINGYPINASTIYDPADPYKNRDPRLSLWVAYNGSEIGPSVNRHVILSLEGGIDAYHPFMRTSRTSYYLRKLLRPKTVSLLPQYSGNAYATSRTHIILGKPELYLTFAEAANEAWGVVGDPNGYGFNAKAVLEKILLKHGCGSQYLNNVIDENQAEFRKYIRNCRRLDLSFEGHYYYDLRRWINDGTSDALNVEVFGMKITKIGENPDQTPKYSYERVLLEKRDFKSPQHPIPYSELYNAPEIVQNAGW